MLRLSTYSRIAARLVGVVAVAALLPGCATLIESVVDSQLSDYFHDAGAPPVVPVKQDLASLRFSEYWTGIVFNGEKIGFSRLEIKPAAGEPGRYEVQVVDPIGAGDAYVAGFLWATLRDRPVQEAIDVGQAVAALKCSMWGDVALVSARDVEEVQAGGPSVRR